MKVNFIEDMSKKNKSELQIIALNARDFKPYG
jgi:hypothetical protein